MTNVKAIFIDSEGTLRNEKKEISEYTIELIKKLDSRGIHIVITTGLPRFLSRDISLKANASRYLISSNGADIYDTLKGENIKSSYIDQEIIKEIYNLSNKDYNLILGIGEYEYSNLKNEYNLKAKSITDINKLNEGVYQVHLSQRKFEVTSDNYQLEMIKFIRDYDIEKLKLLIGNSLCFKVINNLSLTKEELEIVVRAIRYLKLFSLKSEILRKYNEFIGVGNQSIDFYKFQIDREIPWFSLNKKGVSKGMAIKYLCNYLNIDINETIGIGNDYNDKSMIGTVGTFICPSNAREFIKSETDVLCRNNEGVNKILKMVYEKR